MHADLQIHTHVPASPRTAGATALLAILACVLFPLAWYWETTFSIVSIWERSETFAHGFAVIPIFAYLVWRRCEDLALTPIAPCPAALAGLAIAGLAWVIGELGSILGLSHFALVSMIPLAIWAVLGTTLVRKLAFPLAFLFFAVPFGEFLVPTLIDWTADFTIAALQASGIPVYREGQHFQIPTGSWSVVEACSGIRYLIASLMAGTLYAYLTYRSPRRRLIFMGFAILVPIVANWLRAYMIVMLGHLSGNRIAVGVDHIIYGWIFFGVVIGVLFFIGSRWREDESPVPVARSVGSPGVGSITVDARWIGTVLAALVLIAVWKPVHGALTSAGSGGAPQLAQVNEANGWRDTAQKTARWRPHFVGPTAERSQGFEKGSLWVGLYLGYYRDQVQGAELVGSQNQLVVSNDSRWKKVAAGEQEIQLGGSPIRVRTAEIVGPGVRLRAWQWYWINGRLTSSDYAAKAYTVLDRLLGRGDHAAVVVVYAPMRDPRDTAATDALSAFVADMAPGIAQRLDEARGR